MIVANTFNENLTEESKKLWLSYWKYHDKDTYCHCAEVNCTNKHEHGVLVKQVQFNTEALFVIPLCKQHSNSFNNQIEVDDHAGIVSANLCM